MKNLFLLILCFTANFVISQQTWTVFTDSVPIAPEFVIISSDSTTFRFSVEVSGMFENDTTFDNTTYQRINIQGYLENQESGYPEIPSITKYIAIPDCDNYNISFSVTNQLSFNNYNIFPTPIEETFGDTISGFWVEEVFKKDTNVYNTDQTIPDVVVDCTSSGSFRGQKYILLQINPLQYNPITKQLLVNSNIDIEINFNNSISAINKNTGVFNNIASNTFLNYSSSGITAEINDQSSNPGQVRWYELNSVEEASNIIADYLIVSESEYFSYNDLNSEIYRIANHRAIYNGFDVAIVDIQDVWDLNFYYNNNEPEYMYEQKLRSMIKKVYEGGNAYHTYDGKLGYILLVGDAIGYEENNTDFGVPASFDPNPGLHIPGNQHGVYNDYYYSCLTEEDGEYDNVGDVFIGRFSIRNTDQLHNIVEKTIYYENEADFSDWRCNTMHSHGSSGGTDYPEAFYTWLENTMNIPTSNYSLDFINAYEVWDDWNIETIDAINNGIFYGCYIGHGSVRVWSGYNGIWTEDFINNLTNSGMNPFIISGGCYTCDYTNSNKPFSIGEEIVNYSPTHGFLAYLGYSTAGGFNPALPIQSPPIYMHESIPFSIWNNLSHIVGEFILESKLALPFIMHGDRFNYNLMGDPALNLMASGFEITRDLMLEGDITISSTVILREGNTLTLNANLNFVDNGELIIENGATFKVGEVTIQGINENNRILLQGSLIQSSDPPHLNLNAPQGHTWTGIVFDNSFMDYSIENAAVERCGIKGSAHSMEITNSNFYNAYLEFSTGSLEVDHCTFTESYIHASRGTLAMPIIVSNSTFNNEVIFEYPITIDDYKLFEIHGNTILHNDKTGIAIYNSKGTKGAEVHQIYDNIISSKTVASGNTDFGIRVYNSHADIVDDNYVFNNYVGLVCYNTSEVDLVGDCNATSTSTAQRIINNSLRQVYTDENSFPTTFRYNAVYDNNASTYYVYYARETCPPIPDTEIKNNYWGDSFDPDEHLYPTACFNYSPFWNFGCDKNGTVENQYDSAVQYVINEEYNLAENMFKNIIINHAESKYAKASVKQLFALKDIYDQDYEGLKSFFDTTLVFQDTSDISKLAYWLSNKCDVKMLNYQTAVDWYENIIDNPGSENDSTFAIIDLGYAYLLMGDSSQRSFISCKYPQYNISGQKEYNKYRNKLLERLIENQSNATNIQEPDYQNKTALNELRIYPNPVNDKLKVGFSLLNRNNVSITIYDKLGRLVYKTENVTLGKGNNEIFINCSSLRAGLYCCKFFIENGNIYSGKFIKL